jgi:hypothetical protein
MKSHWFTKMEQREFFSSVLCVVQQLASRLGRFNSKGSQIMHVLEIPADCIAYLDTLVKFILLVNPLTPELNPSAQRCLTRYFTGDFAS